MGSFQAKCAQIPIYFNRKPLEIMPQQFWLWNTKSTHFSHIFGGFGFFWSFLALEPDSGNYGHFFWWVIGTVSGQKWMGQEPGTFFSNHNIGVDPPMAQWRPLRGQNLGQNGQKMAQNDKFSHRQVWHIKTALFSPLNNLMPFVWTNFDFLVPLLAKSGQKTAQTAQKI